MAGASRFPKQIKAVFIGNFPIPPGGDPTAKPLTYFGHPPPLVCRIVAFTPFVRHGLALRFFTNSTTTTMQKSKRFTWAALGAALLTAGMIMPSAHAQSADALLDKLVDKGVLSVKEAQELREQSDDGFNKAFQAKTGMPDWVSQFRIYGDVRGRYEFFKTENDTANTALTRNASTRQQNEDRTRLRYRLRVGATATLLERLEVGFRLTSSEPNADGTGGDPISGNTTLQNNGSKKFIYVDTAYGKWTPISHGPWLLSATVGKMDNPFTFSDMVFDGDYTPEGFALQAGYTFNDQHALKLNAGYFMLDEINQGAQASDDPTLVGAQLRFDSKWSPKLSSSVGLAFMTLTDFQNLGSAAVPNVQGGNSRYPSVVTNSGGVLHAANELVNSYHPVIADASVTYMLDKFPLYKGAFPIKIGGEYMHNSGAKENNDGYWGGIFLGKSGKKGAWELSYRYKVLEEDAWYEEFVDSDFGAYREVAFPADGGARGYRAGTGVQGHITKFVYSVSDGFTVGATWFYTESTNPGEIAGRETDSEQHRVQLDAIWKF